MLRGGGGGGEDRGRAGPQRGSVEVRIGEHVAGIENLVTYELCWKLFKNRGWSSTGKLNLNKKKCNKRKKRWEKAMSLFAYFYLILSVYSLLLLAFSMC